jgi:hypothetical protein
MAHEHLVVVPKSDLVIEVPMAQVPAAPLPVPAPTAQRLEALDDIFAQQGEDRTVMGLLGVWGSVMLLHDLAAEHLAPPANPDDRPRSLPRPDDEPDEEPGT